MAAVAQLTLCCCCGQPCCTADQLRCARRCARLHGTTPKREHRLPSKLSAALFCGLKCLRDHLACRALVLHQSCICRPSYPAPPCPAVPFTATHRPGPAHGRPMRYSAGQPHYDAAVPALGHLVGVSHGALCRRGGLPAHWWVAGPRDWWRVAGVGACVWAKTALEQCMCAWAEGIQRLRARPVEGWAGGDGLCGAAANGNNPKVCQRSAAKGGIDVGQEQDGQRSLGPRGINRGCVLSSSWEQVGCRHKETRRVPAERCS